MSTLNVSNITDGTTTVGTSYVVNGSTKVWALRSTGGTPSLSGSFNVSSLVDAGTGDTDYNLTNSLSDTNGAIAVSNRTSSNRRGIYSTYTTASEIRTLVYSTSGTAIDDSVALIGTGDLA